MRIRQILAGVLLGIVVGYLGTFGVYHLLYKDVLPDGFNHYLFNVPKLIAPCIQLGLIPNAGLFFLLLKFNKDEIARGVLAITMAFIIALVSVVYL